MKQKQRPVYSSAREGQKVKSSLKRKTRTLMNTGFKRELVYASTKRRNKSNPSVTLTQVAMTAHLTDVHKHWEKH